MVTLNVLVGGASITPRLSNKERKKTEVAKASLQDSSLTVNRVTAARMRNATVAEMNRLSKMSIADFRQLLLWQGLSTERFNDRQLQQQLNMQVLLLRNLAVELLNADVVQAQTPIIISGSYAGGVGMVTKILGPTAVASQYPMVTAVWWECNSVCRIETIHYFDKNIVRELKP
ncbi:hypothetical protein [Alkalimonas amylolytica]|uniref:Uncharacterized protein n=1 Tax=Alkalimonas amylolytica TaxID=152573 RepID=A0A1H4E2X8_ALKAM|nr:hypothetical protein [Alkalimonas amylolytica]SEA79375.1 hypothetical protein SAMN04488051_106189 [Alkalimonas amylolytica]